MDRIGVKQGADAAFYDIQVVVTRIRWRRSRSAPTTS
jgi:hypothetical protein